jgi:hypothetical protein
MKALDCADMASSQEEMRSSSQEHIQTREKVRLLLIASMDRSHALHDAFLEARNEYQFTATEFQEMWLIPDYRELWVIPGQDAVHLAVVHETLSHFELDETCRFIRRRWSSARILVIRAGEEFLDDALYDARVMPSTPNELLHSAIQRLLERRRE